MPDTLFTVKDRRDIERMAKRLTRRYDRVPEPTRARGRAWYLTALATAERIDGEFPSRAAGVIAALSPRNYWSQNVRQAAALIAWADDDTRGMDDRPNCHTYVQMRKADALARYGEPADWLTGPKESAFCANILGDTQRVTVDAWATLAACGRAYSPARGRAYDRFQAAYRVAARRRGETPRDFQAIIWCHIRGAAD